MIAWKLLQPGSVGLYSGFSWPVPIGGAPGAWVEVDPPLVASLRGVHAVRTVSLVDWLDDELWEIELDGEIVESDALLVSSRGRLRRRIAEWDAQAATALTESCVLAVRDAAVEALARSGATHPAARLGGLSDPVSLRTFVSDATRGEGAAAIALAYLLDCLSLAVGGRPDGLPRHPGGDLPTTPGAIAANIAFVAAASIGTVAAADDDTLGTFEQTFERERERQRRWLSDRLNLDAHASNTSS